MGLFDHGARDDGTVLQHILQVHKVAVVHMLGEIVHVVEVDNALLMGLHDVGGEKHPLCQVLGDLARHVVPLDGVDLGILVGVLLHDLLVVGLDEGEDLLVGGVGLADQGAGVAVTDVALGGLVGAGLHDLSLHQLLDLLHGQGPVKAGGNFLDAVGDGPDLGGGQLPGTGGGRIGLGHGGKNFLGVEQYLLAAALDDFHSGGLPSLRYLWQGGRFPKGGPACTG